VHGDEQKTDSEPGHDSADTTATQCHTDVGKAKSIPSHEQERRHETRNGHHRTERAEANRGVPVDADQQEERDVTDMASCEHNSWAAILSAAFQFLLSIKNSHFAPWVASEILRPTRPNLCVLV
jgi:hypothetical protein